jgi:transposase-like protein
MERENEVGKVSDGELKSLNGVIQVNEGHIRDHLGEMIRTSVEETLNKLLDDEADALCGAQRYERSPDRVDMRAGHYHRKLETRVGEVDLKVPKLRKRTFDTAIIERYRRRETSMEEALVEMYLAGVSVRRVENITEVLWGSRVSASTVSQLNQKIGNTIETWRNRPLTGEYPYVYLDGIWLKRCWGEEVEPMSVLVAIGVNLEGHREIIGVQVGSKEDKESWRKFLTYLKGRGLQGVRLVISDKCMGLVESLPDFFPKAKWQRCMVHFYRNIMTDVPRKKLREVMDMAKAIHAQENLEEARKKAASVVEKLKDMKLKEAAKTIANGIEETLTYMQFHREHWVRIRTNNPLERIMREIRRRTRVVGVFPDEHSALLLVAARLRYIAGTKWGTRRYLDMTCFKKIEEEQVA